MPSQRVLQLCASPETVIAAVAANPKQAVTKIAKSLFKDHSKADGVDSKGQEGGSELDLAAKCGQFPYRPSDLFLTVFNDVLGTIESDPLANLCSPSLIGSSGTLPLTIISVIPDIMRHYAQLIIRARSEVFLATNYWENSHSSEIICDALKELSKRVEARSGEKVVVKVMYDRGTPSQVINNHANVKEQDWTKPEVGLPKRDEVPFLDLQVVNYHRPLLGTFHSKFMVVDRAVACLNSNNVQDRPNVEMMAHLEGPIVDSFYDMALQSWGIELDPQLPLINNAPPREDFKFQKDNEHLGYIDTENAGHHARKLLQRQNDDQSAQEQPSAQPTLTQQAKRTANKATGHAQDQKALGKDDAIAEHPAMTVPTMSQEGVDHDGQANNASETRDANRTPAVDGQTGGANQQANDTPVNDVSLTSETGDIRKQEYTDDTDITAEDTSAIKRVADHLNAGNMTFDATVQNPKDLEDFRPHILHESHKPFPIAMVNRRSRGTPGHDGVHKVPQDVAWLSALKNAKQNVFIQSPTFNASPVIPAVVDACKRGVQVTIYADLGFNDLGEMIPFQGGTNEVVIHKMYQELNGLGKHKNLKVYWYVSKDQMKPISATAKKRNCHVKFMSVDDQIAIFGNGNQDTQSWFHSQEVNVMIDSPEVVAELVRGINANQNTLKYGLVSDEDGIYRDTEGNVVDSSGVKSGSVLSGMKGFSGAIARVRGTGGF